MKGEHGGCGRRGESGSSDGSGGGVVAAISHHHGPRLGPRQQLTALSAKKSHLITEEFISVAEVYSDMVFARTLMVFVLRIHTVHMSIETPTSMSKGLRLQVAH